MDKMLSYGLMLLVVAALYLLYWRKTKPIRDACDRFANLFMEARDHAVGGENCLPRVAENDGFLLLPAEEQSEAVRAMLARGAGGEMARYDEMLESVLRELFRHIGKNQHLKSRYFDYLNTFFTLHKLFLRVCAAPATHMAEADWKDLALYMGDRQRLVQILSMRLSDQGKRNLTREHTMGQPQFHGREETG